MKRVVGIIGTLLLCFLANAVLVGGQKLWHSGDQRRLNEIKKELDTERPKIESMGYDLKLLSNDLDSTLNRLSKLELEIGSIESDYPNGVPSSVYDDYSSKVDEYNSLIGPYNDSLTIFKSMRADYSAQVDHYNTLVDEGNLLAKKIGTTWYIVPIGAFR